jgi:hypothetical protein
MNIKSEIEKKRTALISQQIRRYGIPASRVAQYTALAQLALTELPIGQLSIGRQKNGEGIFHDEAEIQKRVISYRIAKQLQPETILESHSGIGVGSALYMRAAPKAKIKSLAETADTEFNGSLVDIDPFGQPWDVLLCYKNALRRASVIQVTSGEIYSVVRNWKRTFRFATRRVGRRAPEWVTAELVPRVEEITAMKCQFFYAFPTSARLILSSQRLPKSMWKGCGKWLWWFSKHGGDHE